MGKTKPQHDNNQFLCGDVERIEVKSAVQIDIHIRVQRKNSLIEDPFRCSAFDEMADKVRALNPQPGDLVKLRGPTEKNKPRGDWLETVRVEKFQLTARKGEY